MNINRDDIYITLFSDASNDIYTLNSQTSFTNRLALPVDLSSSSDCLVRLAEISYKPPERMMEGGALVDTIGKENVFVYCDLVAPQLVGSELKSVCELLLLRHKQVNTCFLIFIIFQCKNNYLRMYI